VPPVGFVVFVLRFSLVTVYWDDVVRFCDIQAW